MSRFYYIYLPVAYRRRLQEAHSIPNTSKPRGLVSFCKDGPTTAFTTHDPEVSPEILDPDWTRRRGRRRNATKYRVNRDDINGDIKSGNEQSPNEGQEITLATPYLRRSAPNGSHLPSSPFYPDNSAIAQTEDKFVAAGPLPVLEALEHVLKTTSLDSGPVSRSGARALTKMCLRRVPENILDEQCYRLSLDPDNRTDVSAETYADLDDFDLVTGSKNCAIRRVVRAHAIHMFTSLLHDEVIEPTTMRFMCPDWLLRRLDSDEIEDIIFHWMHATLGARNNTPGRDSHIWGRLPEPFQILDHFQHALKARLPTLTYRILTRLICSRTILVEELGHPQLRRIWRGAIRSIAIQGTESIAAMKLIETTLTAASGVSPEDTAMHKRPLGHEPTTSFLLSQLDWSNIDFEDAQEDCYSALVTMVTSVCTLLTATAVVRRQDEDYCNGHVGIEPPLRPLRSAAASIGRAYSFPSFSRRAGRTGFPLIAAIVSLADLHVETNESRGPLILSQTQSQLRRLHSFYNMRRAAASHVFVATEVDKRLADFLSDVKTCGQRACPRLYKATTWVPSFSQGEPPYHESVKRDNITAIIRELESSASQSNPKHNSTKATCLRPIWGGQSLSKKPKESHGFRWEEGIEEWVAMTPAPLTSKEICSDSSLGGCVMEGWRKSDIPGGAIVRSKTPYSCSSGESHPALQVIHMPEDSVAVKDDEDEDELAQADSPSIFRAKKRVSVSHQALGQRKRYKH
ncbi:hypothetical protein FH972_026219 [Carpinus fangiana]|uniref:Uncharacterized protein n=1 Tax=Carpinus fangiana TaxID=176857 RepID=A0A5N6L3D7_9ROSI|nr:hypothetical protein FH972_026219 [Carpinus fangiana]